MKISAISVSDRKGIRKKNIDSANLVENFGIEGDAHGGKWHRQLSFLAQESIDTMRDKGLDVVAGNFAENITTTGIDLPNLHVGDHLKVGKTEVIISQLGKVCHHRCAIYHQAGDCVMPREGIFGIVAKGGAIRIDDPIVITSGHSTSGAIIGSPATEKELGVQLKQNMARQLSTAFVRFDRLDSKENNLPNILEDLVNLQHIDHVLLYDPEGKYLPTLFDYKKKEGSSNTFLKKGTTIYYCRNLGETENL